ncbi:MAG: hypothetical protein ACRDBG_11950 [Waterburya sp.]
MVKKGLSEGSETPEGVVLDMFYDQRIDTLSERLEDVTRIFQQSVEKTERLEYQICCLEDSLSSLKEKLNAPKVQNVTDDEIAAMTGQRVQTVWEWRHGLRKPRGKRVLKALEGIQVKDGKWQKPC